MDLGSNKRKKVFESSIRKLKKLTQELKLFHRVQILESRIDFYASRRLLISINDHTESSDHNRDRWIMNFVANVHVCNDPKWLLNHFYLSNEDVHLHLVDGEKVNIETFGDVYLKFDQGSFIIRRITCVTKLNMNVIYVAKFHKIGCKIFFDDHVTFIRENATLSIGRKQ